MDTLKNSLLIVDDDSANLMELISILKPEYSIQAAKDGNSAITIAERSFPDLILLDVVMPDMNGFEVLKELQKIDATKNIPVIFITGLNKDGSESEGLEVGAVDYIHKPFDADVVRLRVRHQIQIVNLKRDLKAAAEAADIANHAKSDFLAKMSHEIRTPLNAVIGISEANIQSDNLQQSIKEDFTNIYSSGKLLLGIINELLDFSKIEAGKMDIIPAQYELASLINDSIQLNVVRIGEKPVKFDLQIEDNLPARLVGDNIRIAQIINNLLSNAFKYTNEGIVILSFDVQTNGGNDTTLVIRVRDTGRGMTKDQLNVIFDEYARFDEKNNRTIEGTGLGLAITKRLINLMGGDIIAESEPGAGSLFVVKLPQEKVNDDVMGKELTDNLRKFHMNFSDYEKHHKIARNPMPYGNVLIVDDMEPNLYVATRLMKLYKLRIDTVMSGKEAIKKVKNGKVYDIIFVDHMMPEMDGIETMKLLREMGYKHTLVALTANAIVGQADFFLQSGFDDFISKPINIHQLDIILNKYVRNKSKQKLIFLVDDNDENLNASATALESEYQVMTMISAEKMFFLLDRKKPDMIILKTSMPGMSSDSIDKLKKRLEGMGIAVMLLEKTIEPSKLLDVVMNY
jgi:signal transduction histidine kinase